MTQAVVAELLDMDRANYSRIEKRGEKLTIEQLTGIAKALGVSLGEILGLESKPTAINAEQVKQLGKRVGELDELSGLLRKQNEKLMNSIEIAAKTFIPEIHNVMINMAFETGFLNEDNAKGYLTFIKDKDDGSLDFDISDECNLHTDFFLFDILNAKQLERMVDDLPPIHSYCLQLLANTDAIINEKLKQAWKDMMDYYYRRSLKPFVLPDPLDYLSLKNK